MRSSLTPLFGRALSGLLGNIIDIVTVVATILGVAQTLIFGPAFFGLQALFIGIWDYIVALPSLMSFIVVVLLMTYLVTKADSAVLIVNTINAAGD